MVHLYLENATVEEIEKFLLQDAICNHWSINPVIIRPYVHVYSMTDDKPLLQVEEKQTDKVLCFTDDGEKGIISIVPEGEFDYFHQTYIGVSQCFH